MIESDFSYYFLEDIEQWLVGEQVSEHLCTLFYSLILPEIRYQPQLIEGVFIMEEDLLHELLMIDQALDEGELTELEADQLSGFITQIVFLNVINTQRFTRGRS